MVMHANPGSATAAPRIRPAWRYDSVAIALHWVSALLIAATAGLGWYMLENEEAPGIRWFFDLHRSIGVVIALLLVIRVLWRVAHRPEALPASVPTWQARLASGAQVLLYLLMIAMVVTGYLGSSYTRSGVSVFGLSTPHWAVPNREWAHQLFDIHSALVWFLVAVVVAHVLGAIKHLVMDKDGVFQRMWYARR
jgi:cytochrome b561